MKQGDPIRILIADDHMVVREGLAAILRLESDLSVVGEAANGEEAVRQYRELQPDIVLMDLRMPVMNGIAAIQAIRTDYPSAQIIMLTTYDADEDIFRGLQSGARAWLLKDIPREDLVNTVRVVNSGQTVITPAIASKLAEHMSQTALTPREVEILSLIVDGKSNKQIGVDLYITEGTVKSHVNSVLTKLGVSDRTQAAIAALQRGIVHLRPKPPPSAM